MGQGARIGAHPGAALLLLSVCASQFPWLPAASAQIQWRTPGAAARQAPRLTPEQAADALVAAADAAARAGRPHRIVVGFDGPLTESNKRDLAEVGVTLLAYVGDNSFFASVNPEALQAQAAVARAPFRQVVEIEREWKMHPDFAAGVLHPWGVSGAPVKGDQEQHAREKTGDVDGRAQAPRQEEARIAAYVLFHQDVDLDGEGLPALERHGVDIRSVLDPINGAVIEFPLDALAAIVGEDVVQWIEPPLPVWGRLNAENRVLTGANTVQAAPYSLNGTGIDVLVFDAGRVRSHGDFTGRLVAGDSASFSDHATHVAGTVGGSGAGSTNTLARGMAPACRLISFGFQWGGGSGFLYTDPGDLQGDYTSAINLHGADIANNSIGNNTESNGLPCDWQGNYGVTDVLIDSIVRGSLGAPFRVFWAAGNERTGNRCDEAAPYQDYRSLAPPACAKNHICVGATNANDDSMTSFSSWGPTDDGRMRPDFCAPGCQSNGDLGVTSTWNIGDYASLCGTSMAAPTATGCAALLLQDFRAQFPGLSDPRNSTLKVLFAHTAVDILTPGPDYRSGYGSLRIQPAVDLMRAGDFFEGEVSQGGTPGFAVVIVSPGTPQLKITLAWDDAPGTANVLPALINDLDLVVTSPGGVQFFPWTLDPSAPSDAAVRTVRNSRDNLEQVLVDSPEPGTWLVEVRAFNVPQGPQPFSICGSPGPMPCSHEGVVAFDAGAWPCESEVSLRVTDCGLDTNPAAIETVQLRAFSTTDPTGIDVLLTESGPSSPTFQGSFMLSASGGGGALAASPGDVLTAEYEDSDTGSGSPGIASATALVDCLAPGISSVAVELVEPRRAVITFVTDEPCVGTVRYGLACGTLGSSRNSPAFGTNHSVEITGLSDNTGYFFIVEASDAASNLSFDDNSGSCYDFMTPDAVNTLTEIFEPLNGDANDIGFSAVAFVPNSSPDGYEVCNYPIAVLPTNPAGGTFLSMSDDRPGVQINLTGGASVSLFGVSYTSFFLNPNGNITFDIWDDDPTESISDHFDVPRISALFDDLDPSVGGSVSWKQLSDRVVITFTDVPQWNFNDRNTFQFELFFDGRIIVNYLRIDCQDGLVGLSSGVAPIEFLETDLSSEGPCGPRPPRAVVATVTTQIASAVSFMLPSADDGLPDPPGSLQYIVTSLPTHGLLVDPGAGPISSVPHTLAGSAGAITYSPFGRFQGLDPFTFKVNDSGIPPDGGDSNEATLTVEVGAAGILFAFLSDDQDPGWPMDSAWAFGQPTGQGGALGGGFGNPDPFSGFTGFNVLGYNLNGNYPGVLIPTRYLTSAAINCSTSSKVTIQFYRWLGVEHSAYDHATFEVSNDGFNWSLIWENPPAFSLNPTGWELDLYNISSVADGAPTLFLRWGMGPTDGTVEYCGWNIDDITIRGLRPLPPCPGDGNFDRVVNFFDTLATIANFGRVGATQREGDTDANGIVDFMDVIATLANFGVVCP